MYRAAEARSVSPGVGNTAKPPADWRSTPKTGPQSPVHRGRRMRRVPSGGLLSFAPCQDDATRPLHMLASCGAPASGGRGLGGIVRGNRRSCGSAAFLVPAGAGTELRLARAAGGVGAPP